MRDSEHDEWLENCNAHKAAPKKKGKVPLVPPKVEDEKPKVPENDGSEPLWRGEY